MKVRKKAKGPKAMGKQYLIQPNAKSSIHRGTMAILEKMYPGYTLLEEEGVRVSDGGRQRVLHVDILVKEIKVCIECHGEQHFKFVPHFHQTVAKFEDQQRRDRLKAEAIKDAGYVLVEIRFDEKLTPAQLQRRILKAIKESSK